VRPRPGLAGLALAGLALLGVVALADEPGVTVEDWSRQSPGSRGIPAPWQRQSWGSPRYDFIITEDEGRRALWMKSAGDSSNINLDLRGRVRLKETPLLEWSWKVVALPKGADSRRAETDDQAGQVYVVWPRFPQAVRSRVIGYVWDTAAPAGSVIKSQKTGTVTYVVLRSGTAELGRWLTERRNVAQDFKRIYGEDPEDPGALSIGIDSDDVKGTAEAYVGALFFRKP
jgi:hypothetical protein